MNTISPNLLKTWLFLAKSQDTQLAQAKFIAYRKIKQNFGSIELAQYRLEQMNDKEIEIVVI